MQAGSLPQETDVSVTMPAKRKAKGSMVQNCGWYCEYHKGLKLAFGFMKVRSAGRSGLVQMGLLLTQHFLACAAARILQLSGFHQSGH